MRNESIPPEHSERHDPGDWVTRASTRWWAVGALVVLLVVVVWVQVSGPTVICPECENPYRVMDTRCDSENPNHPTAPGGYVELSCSLDG